MFPITKVAEKIKLTVDDLYLYGPYMAKLLPAVWEKIKNRPDGKLILITAMTPTPAGEGKTVTTIGLAQGLARLGEKVAVALREPSLGPVFGMKGGATGGGQSCVEPSAEINLHFTGDFHALTTAQNLLASLIDNHLYFGNELKLDQNHIVWQRALDLNDRALREVRLAVGQNGERTEHFLITAASELMAVLCLSTDAADLRERISRIIVGYTGDGEPVTAQDLKAVGAMGKLLEQAIKPNLVQTTEGVPALIHGGPFANIAHGCNSLLATRYALKLADYVVTEAGFGADLGAEKFFDIKCRVGGLKPSLAVVVATVRALKYHGGGGKEVKSIKYKVKSMEGDLEELKRGMENLKRHIGNVKKFGVPVVVAVNRFVGDSDEELAAIVKTCEGWSVPAMVSDGFNRGGEGCRELAKTVLVEASAAMRSSEAEPSVPMFPAQARPSASSSSPFEEGVTNGDGEKGDGTTRIEPGLSRPPSGSYSFRPLYPLEWPLKRKIEMLAKEIYGASGIDYSDKANKDIKILSDAGMSELPVCIAKTQYSFSDDPKKLNVPKEFRLTVREVYPAAGAGFVVVLTGEIMTMPGLPRHPLAEGMS